jgi:protein SCO1/2
MRAPLPCRNGYVNRMRPRGRALLGLVDALTTIALVASFGDCLGSRLNPVARDRRVFGPPAIPSFVGRDQDGHEISAKDLRGELVIGDFIFTRCQGVCPTLTAHMIALQRSLSVPNVRFLSFSLDPDFDTPAVLKAYATRWKGDAARWSLVTLDSETLGSVQAAIESASPQGSASDGEPHTTRFFLANARGLILGAYDGQDDQSIHRLAADAAALR